MKTILKANSTAARAENIDDIIFEGRNIEYGAYALRKDYNNHLMLSLLAAITFVFIAAGIPYLRAILIPPVIERELPGKEIIFIPTDYIPPVLPPPPANEIIPISILKEAVFGPPVVVEELLGKESFLGPEFDPPYTPELDPGLNGNLVTFPLDIPEIDTTTYKKWEVKEQATFNGGDEENFRVWLSKSIVYPENALDYDIKGKVTLRFTINKEGIVSDVSVIRGIHPLIDEAAKEAVLKSPKWVPAKIDGNPVKVSYHLPISFNIQR